MLEKDNDVTHSCCQRKLEVTQSLEKFSNGNAKINLCRKPLQERPCILVTGNSNRNFFKKTTQKKFAARPSLEVSTKASVCFF